MTADPASPPVTSLDALSRRLADDLATLDTELTEVDLLVTQARTEAGRHETRRAAAADKLAALPADADGAERLELTTSLVGLTRRAALMESQVDVLEGKRRALGRYREALSGYVTAAGGIDPASGGDDAASGDGAEAPMTAAMSRVLANAQEDLRRDIARAMHDGPAQSLTNIVLQAQIVERIAERDPAASAAELRQLIAMVQQTLEATKSFIFDVRPMVLDDLGLVPTLRRSTRERGQRAGIPVEFETMGQDRRLPVDLESGLFRILDGALVAYLGAHPDRVALRLDWGDRLDVVLEATRAVAAPSAGTGVAIPAEEADKDLPPALAMMVEARRATQRDAAAAAVRAAIVALPPPAWRDIEGRAASIGVEAELEEGGGRLRLSTAIPALDAISDPAASTR